MFYKKSLKISLITSLLIAIYFCIATYVLDPLQIIHTPWGRKTTFINNMREQSLGIIKHQNFDSIILGNSLLENTSADFASKTIGGKFINISTSGVLYPERYNLLNYALEKKEIKNIITIYDSNFSIYKQYSAGFKQKAYSDNILSQLQLYSNSKYLSCIFLLKTSEKCVGKEYSLDMPNIWEKNETSARLFGGFENWVKYSSPKNILNMKTSLENYHKKTINNEKNYDKTLELSKEIIKTNLINLARKNPQTNFHIIIPPYHPFFWASQEISKNSNSLYLSMITYLVDETKNIENIKIYWFYDHKTNDDISEYKDPIHYSSKFNQIFIKSIADKNHIINSENINDKINKLNNKIKNFDTKLYLNKLTVHS